MMMILSGRPLLREGWEGEGWERRRRGGASRHRRHNSHERLLLSERDAVPVPTRRVSSSSAAALLLRSAAKGHCACAPPRGRLRGEDASEGMQARGWGMAWGGKRLAVGRAAVAAAS